jgi:hypothetical protein
LAAFTEQTVDAGANLEGEELNQLQELTWVIFRDRFPVNIDIQRQAVDLRIDLSVDVIAMPLFLVFAHGRCGLCRGFRRSRICCRSLLLLIVPMQLKTRQAINKPLLFGIFWASVPLRV